jgi:DNA polymerase III subunit gamma/tau
VDRWPLDTILTAQQILAEARSRLRGSPHGRLLVELALVRVARLEVMADLAEVISRLAMLEGTGPPALPEKKKLLELDPSPAINSAPAEQIDPDPKQSESGPPWEIEAIQAEWPHWTEGLEADLALKLVRVAPSAIFGPNHLAVSVDRAYNWVADACEAPELRARIEARLAQWLRRQVTVRFDRPASDPTLLPLRTSNFARDEALKDDPMVRQVVDLFEARAVRVDQDDSSSA